MIPPHYLRHQQPRPQRERITKSQPPPRSRPVSYTSITPKPPPWASPKPTGTADRALDEWETLAAGLVRDLGLTKVDAMAKALSDRPDLVARLEADPIPRYPEEPVRKDDPLGPAGRRLQALADELRADDRTLTGPQSIAKAAYLYPHEAAAAIEEDLAR